MNVTEMIDSRKKLESSISDLIGKFENRTGMLVTDIDILKSYHIGGTGDRSQMFTDINLEVKLP